MITYEEIILKGKVSCINCNKKQEFLIESCSETMIDIKDIRQEIRQEIRQQLPSVKKSCMNVRWKYLYTSSNEMLCPDCQIKSMFGS